MLDQLCLDVCVCWKTEKQSHKLHSLKYDVSAAVFVVVLTVSTSISWESGAVYSDVMT